MISWSIYKALKKIVGFFVGAISLPFRILYGLVELALLLYRAKDYVNSYIGFLPVPTIAIIGLMVTVAVFYKIVGREG